MTQSAAAIDEYSRAEEIANSGSHAVGLVLSIVALTMMLLVSVQAADPWRIVASSVYGTSLIVLFLASTLYHAWPRQPVKQWLKLFDHCAIYFLIAGSYTPFLLVSMRDWVGWSLFAAIWTLALLGVVFKLWLRHRYEVISLASYLLMGWLAVLAVPRLAGALGSDGMIWLVAGGVSYTVGALFYLLDRMPFNHAVWHLFVLAGGVCHFLAVQYYVLPAGT